MCKSHASADGLARLLHDAVGRNSPYQKPIKFFSLTSGICIYKREKLYIT